MCLRWKAIFQNKDGLGYYHHLTRRQLCYHSNRMLCIHTDESANILTLLNHMRTWLNALSDPTLSIGDLINQWFRSWGSWGKKKLLILGVIILVFFFLLGMSILLLCPASSTAGELPNNSFYASESPCWLLRTHCRRGKRCKIIRAPPGGRLLEDVIKRTWQALTYRLDSGILRLFTSSPDLGTCILFAFSTLEAASKK